MATTVVAPGTVRSTPLTLAPSLVESWWVDSCTLDGMRADSIHRPAPRRAP